MHKIRHGFIALGMLLCLATSANAGVSIGIGLPNVSIGINLPLYPDLVPVPGYPVYYAPGVDGNFFFYDGMYWVYQNDNWYASTWYNGPWGYVDPMSVPLFVLRVPVSYYRQPPMYFGGWQSNAAPRWGEHWGHSWEQRRGGWDHWNRGSAPRLAPLPSYQRQYAGDRYPRVEQQRALRTQQYRYQPREKVVSQHFKQAAPKAPAAGHSKQERPQARSPQQQGAPAAQRPQHQGAPAGQRQQQQGAGPGQRQQQQAAPAAQRQQHQGAPAGQRQQQQGAGPGQRQQQQGAGPGQRQQQQAAPAPQRQQQQRGPAAQGQRQQPAVAQHAPQAHEQQQGHEQRGGGQGQNREEGHGR
jgi:hypothetical protein